jgi:nucleoside-diphosphate-sugar epimerase
MSVRGKKVLVTGADGFMGSHLAERLMLEGARVRVFCMYNSQGNLGWLEASAQEIRSEFDVQLGDIRDSRFVDQACKDVEIVFHLAALIAIPYSYVAPESFVDTNIRGTMNVLEGARRSGVRRIVHTSTSEVYGTPASVPIRETHSLSFGTPVTVLRPFNTFGPRQSTRAVTATILLQLLSGKKEISLGRLDTRRDLTYVSDVVDGFLRAGTVEELEGEVVQLGTGRSVSIEELFTMACQVLGVSATATQDNRRLRPNASEVLVLQSDPSRAWKLLGWRPTVTLEEGLERTASWLQENRSCYRPDFLYA